MKEYQLKNYVDDNRKEPILEWLKTLDGTCVSEYYSVWSV